VKTDETLNRIGAAYGKTPAQVCLRWLVQQNVIAIPRTTKVERLSENIGVFDFVLAEEDMAAISAMANPKGRIVDYGFAPKWD
jgi:diketogulonate reductase-like aldo/keto reductase